VARSPGCTCLSSHARRVHREPAKCSFRSPTCLVTPEVSRPSPTDPFTLPPSLQDRVGCHKPRYPPAGAALAPGSSSPGLSRWRGWACTRRGSWGPSRTTCPQRLVLDVRDGAETRHQNVFFRLIRPVDENATGDRRCVRSTLKDESRGSGRDFVVQRAIANARGGQPSVRRPLPCDARIY
jgi:hypothetical protein